MTPWEVVPDSEVASVRQKGSLFPHCSTDREERRDGQGGLSSYLSLFFTNMSYLCSFLFVFIVTNLFATVFCLIFYLCNVM